MNRVTTTPGSADELIERIGAAPLALLADDRSPIPCDDIRRHQADLTSHLKSTPDGRIRRKLAVLLAAWIGQSDSAVRRELLDAIRDPDSRRTALKAVGKLWSADADLVNQVIAVMGDPETAPWAVRALGRVARGRPDVTDLLLRIAADPDTGDVVVQEAIRSLTRLDEGGNPALADAIVRLATDRRPVVRAAVAECLGLLLPRYGLLPTTLVRLAEDRSLVVQRAAVLALEEARCADPSVVEVVLGLLQTATDETLRHNAATALGVFGEGHPDAARVVAAQVASSSPVVRKACVRTLGRIGIDSPDAIATLIGVLDRGGAELPEVQRAAADSLALVGGGSPMAIAALERVVHADDTPTEVRLTAALALTELGVVPVVPNRVDLRDGLLHRCVDTWGMEDHNRDLARLLAHARQESKETVEWLKGKVETQDGGEPLRAVVCAVIREIGPDAAPLAPWVVQWSLGSDRVAALAEEALPAIHVAARGLLLAQVSGGGEANAVDQTRAGRIARRLAELDRGGRVLPTGDRQQSVAALVNVVEALAGPGESGLIRVAHALIRAAVAKKSVATQSGFGVQKLILEQLKARRMVGSRDERVHHAAEEIRAVVAELPRDEQQDAEVEALVGGVAAESPYPEQITEFTRITHTMRVLMARQLEPRFREHLQNDAPKLPTFNAGKEAEQQALFATRKAAFADQKTDELFRLGIGLKWAADSRVCYLSSAKSEKAPFGLYRLLPCGNRVKIKDVSGWAPDQVGWVRKAMSEYVSSISLADAAAPDQRNHLSPNILRKR